MSVRSFSSKVKGFRQSILDTGYAFYRSRVVHVALETGVFEVIGKGVLGAEEIARKMKLDIRGSTLFLNALVSLGLLEKRNHQFKNKPEVLEVCLPGKEKFVGDIVKLQNSGWLAWQNLGQVIRTGKPFDLPPFLENSRSAVSDFIFAMHNTAVGHAEELSGKVSLRRKTRLLDLGGGSGAFTAYFLKANPKLQGTIFDLPGTLRVTRKILARYRLGKRVAFQAGDFLKDPIRGNYDVVFLSHIIHGLSEEDNKKLVKKISGVLEKGGELLIQDFFLNENHAGPEFPALFSLNMLIHTPGGRCYSFSEAGRWMKRAGFSKVTELPFRFPRSIRILKGIK